MSKKSLHPRLPRAEQKKRTQDRLINILLTAIIRANPNHDPAVKDTTRLARAREALLGEPNPRGRRSIADDMELFPVYEAALRFEKDKMKRAFKNFQSPVTKKKWENELNEHYVSETSVAKQFASEFSREMTEQKSTEDWLRKAIGQLSMTTTDMADLEGLVSGESHDAERLERIFSDLDAIGIPSLTSIRR